MHGRVVDRPGSRVREGVEKRRPITRDESEDEVAVNGTQHLRSASKTQIP